MACGRCELRREGERRWDKRAGEERDSQKKVRTQQQLGWRVAPMLIAARHSAGMGCRHHC
jgi:hypothetical protein